MHPPARTHSAHRPDIDGLRAVAILSVLGYHANSHWLPGGFVGVDIFFVISGYLISGIIFRGLDSGTFSFADFYSRRVKRIFPALLIVLILVTAFGWVSLYTDEYQSLGKHVAAGAGFVSNIVLWKEAGYFDPAGELKPLLHLWSLGIEEQFYLLWPPLFYFVWKRGINPLLAISLIALGSFALNAYWITDHEVRTFYLPATRCWELALGGVLAYSQLRPPQRPPSWSSALDSPLGRNVQAAIGAILLVAAIESLTKFQQFPGWRALLPTLGSFLLIAAGPDAWVNRRLLANRVMVFFGLISYPLYLWHWPLLSFQRIIGKRDLATPTLLTTLAVAVLLAWLTYRFVERPIRTSRWRLRPALTLVMGVALIGTTGYLIFVQDLHPRSADYGLERIIAASEARAFPGPHLVPLSNDETPVMGQGKNNPKVLFLGDSEAEQYYPRIDWLLTTDPAGTRGVIYSSKGGCPPLPRVHENHHPACDGLVEKGISLSKNPDVDTIVVAADWSGYFLGVGTEDESYYFEDQTTKGTLENTMGSDASNKAFLAFEAMIRGFTNDHKAVYIVLPSPTGTIFRPRNMITRSFSDFSFRIRPPNILTTDLVSQLRPVVVKLREIAARTGAVTIDPIASLCSGTTCPVLTSDGQPIFKDASHLNPEFVRANVRYLDDLVKLPARQTATTQAVVATP
jgi:peptidoglycan/LPS O-acetylase OafA/YrhL